MGKGALKFGGKSGVLPAVRQIFKQPIKPVERKIDPNVGYAENVLQPKGTSREQKLPPVYTVNDRIANTVKLPKKELATGELESLNAKQREKIEKSQLRRRYFIESLTKEEQKLETDKIKEERIKALKEAKEKANIVEEIPAAKLTLPTIAKYLDGPLMRNRTPEEKDLLNAKRKANRLNREYNTKLNAASNLLKLYYSAENFITTETDLKKAVEDAFKPGNEIIALINPEQKTHNYNDKIGDALFGTMNARPGLPRIIEHMSGEHAEFHKKVQEADRLRKEQQRDEQLSN